MVGGTRADMLAYVGRYPGVGELRERGGTSEETRVAPKSRFPIFMPRSWVSNAALKYSAIWFSEELFHG